MRREFRSSFWNVLKDENEEEDEAHLCAEAAADWSAKVDDQLDRIQWSIYTTKFKLIHIVGLMEVITWGNFLLDDDLLTKFQKMSRFNDPNEDKDSLSLLCEQETPGMSQDDDSTMDEGRGEKDKIWKCPICPNKPFKYEKSMLNHVNRCHQKGEKMNETLDEASFNPGETSSQDGSKRVAKRKKSTDGHDDDYRDTARARLDTVDEGNDTEVDDALLDMSVNSAGVMEAKPNATQDVVEGVAANMIKAERDMYNLDMNNSGGLDDSLRRDEEKSMKKMEDALKVKDNLLHIRNGKLMEAEGELSELKEVLDQKIGALKVAEKKLGEKREIIGKLRERLGDDEDDEDGPSRAELKKLLAKADATIANLNGRQNNLAKELKTAKANLRKAEVDHRAFEKVQTAMESTLMKIEKLEQKCDELEHENAKLKKKIPCKVEDCDRDRKCQNSHLLKYEDRREPKEKNYRKTLPCKFHDMPGGCKKTDEACDFRHDPKPRQRRVSELSQQSDDEVRYAGRRFSSEEKIPEENNDDSVVEIKPDAKGKQQRWNGSGGARRYTTDDEEEEEMEEEKTPVNKRRKLERNNFNQGNGGGAVSRPRGPAPVRSSREEQRGRSSPGMRQGSASRLSPAVRPDTQSKKRKYSPVRSPSDERLGQRDRYSREDSRDRSQARKAQRFFQNQVRTHGGGRGGRSDRGRDGRKGGGQGWSRQAPRRR